VLFEKRENGADEVRCERACAEQADPDQSKAEGGTGQAQHKRPPGATFRGNGCAASSVDRQHGPAQ